MNSSRIYMDSTIAQKRYEAQESTINELGDALLDIVKSCGVVPEGNCFTEHCSFNKNELLRNKRINLLSLGTLLPPHARVMEIGMNAGHSLMLLLLGSDPTVTFDIYDICYHLYVKPCLDTLRNLFPSRNITLIEGDSKETLLNILLHGNREIYDCIHLDGGHTMDCVTNDIVASMLLLKKGGYLLLDDVDNTFIGGYGMSLVHQGKLRLVEGQETTLMYPHLLFQKL